jgi:hypothetical protein
VTVPTMGQSSTMRTPKSQDDVGENRNRADVTEYSKFPKDFGSRDGEPSGTCYVIRYSVDCQFLSNSGVINALVI